MILSDGKVKGNVDAELVLHAMIEYDNYEKAVIVSGDGDYYCLVNYLRTEEKLLKLIIPNRQKYSSLLKSFIPHYVVFMNELRSKLQYKSQKKERHYLGTKPFG